MGFLPLITLVLSLIHIFLTFYLAQVVFFILYLVLFRVIYKKSSRLLVNNTCMLLAISFIMLTRLGVERAVRQFIITVAAAALALSLIHS